MIIASLLTGALRLFSILVAQDPFAVAPQAYKLQFENEWVRVVRVHYEARERIASHDHPKTATVYVYLKDSGPVRFKHTGEEKFSIDRPPVKAGGFRLGRAVNETHEVESLSDTPTDFVRVELKTEVKDTKTFRGRFPPDTHRIDRSSVQVRFDNAQVRIARMTCAARSKCSGFNTQSRPSLVVAITQSRLGIIKNGMDADLNIDAGQVIWKEANDQLQIENRSASAVELLKVELKTPPAR
jgi:hypothetical protein